MSVITLYTFKGGVGKTLTTIVMAIALSLLGFNVLLIDIDPQSNLTNYFLPNYEGLTLYDCLFNPSLVNEVIQQTRFKNISIIPASMKLVLSNDELIVAKGLTHLKLKKMLEAINEDFAYCMIDCPPYYTELVVNALFVSNQVIIPFQGDKNSQDAFEIVTNTLNDFNEEYGRNIQYRGLFTGKQRNNNDKEVYEQYLNEEKIYSTAIRFQGKPADELSRKGTTLKEDTGIYNDYQEFVNEYLMEQWNGGIERNEQSI